MATFIDCTQKKSAVAGVTKAIASDLLKNPAQISPRYFYDTLGSRLFSALAELPEYYLTQSERALYRKYGPEMADSVGADFTLVDLGAGDCGKAAQLLPSMQLRQYVAVDIAGDYLQESVKEIEHHFPQLSVTAIAADFFSGLELPPEIQDEKLAFFYPGSSIGNFLPKEACAFLHNLCQICRSSASGRGDLLIGIDLIKPRHILEPAYDDALGLTACFNLNVLRHVNRLLGADFDVRNFHHYAYFDAAASRMVMSLVSRCRQTVRWSDGERAFNEGDAILTEYSYKYSKADFIALLELAGFAHMRSWVSERDGFMVCHARSH